MSVQEKKQRTSENGAAKTERLGRGLAALMGDMGPEIGLSTQKKQIARRVPVAFLKPNPRNPRKEFTQEQIDNLAASIKQRGILQPIIVRSGSGADEFEIVAGERRWRAAQKAGLHDVPVIVHVLDDREALEIAIVENVQRTDLDPIEEAAGYQQLISEFNYTQDALANAIGKSRSHVANTMRLLKLPEAVRAHLRSGLLTAGHARALLASDDPEHLAEIMIGQGLNVRDAEMMTRKGTPQARPRQSSRSRSAGKDADMIALEKSLGDALGLRVLISHHGDAGGDLRITYRTLDQLNLVCQRLRASF